MAKTVVDVAEENHIAREGKEKSNEICAAARAIID
jgi:hypothetical protein